MKFLALEQEKGKNKFLKQYSIPPYIFLHHNIEEGLNKLHVNLLNEFKNC
jgi:hypothetical protein